MEENKVYYLTDAMSLKEVGTGIRDAEIKYTRITDPELIKNYIEEHKELITSRIKREGYSYGLFKITGYEFPVSEENIIDLPRGGVAINIGLSNPTKADANIKENWDLGLIDLELRIIEIIK